MEAKEPSARRRTKRGGRYRRAREGTAEEGGTTRGRRGPGPGREGRRGGRGGTRSPPVHTLVVTPTGKVLAFVKVHRRLSGSSAPRSSFRPEEPASRARREKELSRDKRKTSSRVSVRTRPRYCHFPREPGGKKREKKTERRKRESSRREELRDEVTVRASSKVCPCGVKENSERCPTDPPSRI